MPNNFESKCGNCRHFVAGGLCTLVKGEIRAIDTCDFFQAGNPQPISTLINPLYEKYEANYRPALQELLPNNIVQKAIQMEHELLARGIPEEEVHRAVIQYFSEPEPPPALAFPGPVTGLDLAGRVDPIIVPDTGTPLTDFSGLPENVEPYPTSPVNPYPNNPTPDPNSVGSISNTYNIKNPPYTGDNTNWLATSSKVNSEPSMHGEHGFNATKAIPEWRYPIEQSQMEPINIPPITIPPSGVNEICKCKNKILQEAIGDLRSEFGWLTDDYVLKAKELSTESGGKLYLIRAAGETLTDHTSEGELHRRKLSSEELNSMARTAIGKKMDINHQPEYETDATVLDSEFDPDRKEIQMMVIERNPEVIQAIGDNKITAVSINGGLPRSENIEPCDHNCSVNCELCMVPRGVVLGELDNIALTYVVTDPSGMYYNGTYIPKATPGIKFTKIMAL